MTTETQPRIRIISFGSPKGGAGRTMAVANLAALYARGCEWAGLSPCVALAVDLDIQAPGLHFFDFASQLQPKTRIFVGEEEVRAWSGVRRKTSQAPIGLLQWLDATLDDPLLQMFLGSTREDSEVAASLTEFVATKSKTVKGPANPDSHVVRVEQANGPALLLLPAADPGQQNYQAALMRFDALNFFQNKRGYLLLDALYAHLLRHESAKWPRRILLDQGGGLSVAGVVNRAYADHHVIVSGLNEQHRAGLEALAAEGIGFDQSRTSIILSQYGARPLAAGPIGDRSRFLAADHTRHTVQQSVAGRIVYPEHVHTIDFDPDAVGAEYFFSQESETLSELAALAVSIERGGQPPQMTRLPWNAREIRILGEYVGLGGDGPASGALGAFGSWAKGVLDEKGCTTRVFAASHEEIADIVSRSTGAMSKGEAELSPPRPDGSPMRLRADVVQKLMLSDFDVVALPAHLVRERPHLLEQLAGYSDSTIFSSDCLGPVTEEYADASLHGWRSYARSKKSDGSSFIRGYPLFADHQILVVNRSKLDARFSAQFAARYLRAFRGFVDPADVLDAAAVSSETPENHDSFLLTLAPDSLARWYEWRTVIAMFVTQRPDDEPTSRSSEELDPKQIARATRLYFKLCKYSGPHSKVADWDVVNRVFFGDHSAGMLLVWPDAIPAEARDSQHSYEYLRPPGSLRFEECWLLCVPRFRSGDRPSVDAIEQLLRHFLLPSSQQSYLEKGGLPVHRRVMWAIENWRKYAFLAALSWWSDRRPGHMPVERAADENRMKMRKELQVLARLDDIDPEEMSDEDVLHAFATA